MHPPGGDGSLRRRLRDPAWPSPRRTRIRRNRSVRRGSTWPSCDVFRETVADHAKTQIAASKVVNQHQDLMLDWFEWFRLCSNSLLAHAVHGDIVNVTFGLRCDIDECLTQRHPPSHRSPSERVPFPSKNLSLAPQLRCQRGHPVRPSLRLGDQRLKQVEEDRLRHRHDCAGFAQVCKAMAEEQDAGCASHADLTDSRSSASSTARTSS